MTVIKPLSFLAQIGVVEPFSIGPYMTDAKVYDWHETPCLVHLAPSEEVRNHVFLSCNGKTFFELIESGTVCQLGKANNILEGQMSLVVPGMAQIRLVYSNYLPSLMKADDKLLAGPLNRLGPLRAEEVLAAGVFYSLPFIDEPAILEENKIPNEPACISGNKYEVTHILALPDGRTALFLRQISAEAYRMSVDKIFIGVEDEMYEAAIVKTEFGPEGLRYVDTSSGRFSFQGKEDLIGLDMTKAPPIFFPIIGREGVCMVLPREHFTQTDEELLRVVFGIDLD